MKYIIRTQFPQYQFPSEEAAGIYLHLNRCRLGSFAVRASQIIIYRSAPSQLHYFRH